jgi:hypothetical protein
MSKGTGVAAADDMLTEYLAARDVGCPGCGYNLRGLTGRACPECAQALRLVVNLEEPRLGSWIAGLLGTAAGAGFNGLLMAYVAIMLVREGAPALPELGRFLGFNAGGLILHSVILALWIRKGRRFRRAGWAAKLCLIGGAWALSIADVIAFSYTIR